MNERRKKQPGSSPNGRSSNRHQTHHFTPLLLLQLPAEPPTLELAARGLQQPSSTAEQLVKADSLGAPPAGTMTRRSGRVSRPPARAEFVDPTAPGVSFAQPKGGMAKIRQGVAAVWSAAEARPETAKEDAKAARAAVALQAKPGGTGNSRDSTYKRPLRVAHLIGASAPSSSPTESGAGYATARKRRRRVLDTATAEGGGRRRRRRRGPAASQWPRCDVGRCGVVPMLWISGRRRAAECASGRLPRHRQ
eukprot:COSAG01_NODE_5294_length_4352_cov_12.531860_1_plen_250_part_00